MNETWTILYEDDGPDGPCPQCMSVTSPWCDLHVFNDYDAMRRFCTDLVDHNGRRKPRVKLISRVFVHYGDNEHVTSYEEGEDFGCF